MDLMVGELVKRLYGYFTKRARGVIINYGLELSQVDKDCSGDKA